MRSTELLLLNFRCAPFIILIFIQQMFNAQYSMFNFQLRGKLLFCLLSIASCLLISSCSINQKISRSAKQAVLKDISLLTAHVGISIFEPSTGKYWYNHQGDKYFVPASNTKIPTCYAAMKYLGPNLKGLDYIDTDTVLFIRPTADPSFLHRDYKSQPAFEFLSASAKKLAFIEPKWEAEVYASGWAWNDYNSDYMAERSDMPIYGNVIEYNLQEEGNKYRIKGDIKFFRFALNEYVVPLTPNIRIRRRRVDNTFDVFSSTGTFTKAQIPFRTFENQRLLEDTLKKAWLDNVYPPSVAKFKSIYSRPTDSLLKPMMHRSDNFFAEQSLLMVSNELLGVMNDEKIIDTLLKTDLKDLPQRPRWADGSGLSRYNLFTPRDFVAILNKMKNEFGMERIRVIFPTGGEGTISNYYKSDSNYIYAKTGTLSGVVALSGFLYTKKGKLLIFSALVNNHQASATAVRRAVEKFIHELRIKN
jgi:D-alanyl-D-alanine carboxypeptidase/D-alanyl-D-alanine-endopeptidase (penicillin-binding protein 4)